MNKVSLLLAGLLVSSVALAHDRPAYERGKLLEMESVPCGTAENSGKGIAGEILGTDSAHKKTQEVLCQEYVLEGQHIVYRIRPTDMKHPALLPVGEVAEYRIHKDKLFLRVPEGDDHEHEYLVLSMKPREDADDASARPKLSSKQ